MGERSYKIRVEEKIIKGYSEKPIKGLPPKKGANISMWNDKKHIEVGRVIMLREEMASKLQDKIFKKNIQIELIIKTNEENPGDLDNFVSGVCDALMKAHGNAHLSKKFENKKFKIIDPRKVKFIEDDSEITKIEATIEKTDQNKDYYTLRISGEI